jgi:CRP-like cAMP-binding protein
MEVLKLLSKDPNSQIAQIGKEFLDNPTSGEFKRSKAFDFLDRVLFFKKTALFKYVSAEKLMSLAEITQHVVYEKEAVISTQGELSEHLYIVKTGCIRVVRSDGVINTEILKVTSGETYGEIGLFTHAPRSASAIADEHCELYMIKRPALKKLLLEIPDIATSLLEVLSERLRKSGEEVVELKKYFKENRQIENSFNAGEDFTL